MQPGITKIYVHIFRKRIPGLKIYLHLSKRNISPTRLPEVQPGFHRPGISRIFSTTIALDSTIPAASRDISYGGDFCVLLKRRCGRHEIN